LELRSCSWQLDLATSGNGGIKPYIGLCVLVGASGVAGALVEGGMVGDMSFMLPDFIQVSNFVTSA